MAVQLTLVARFYERLGDRRGESRQSGQIY